MNTQKFNHIQGGKIQGVTLIVLAIAVVILLFVLFAEENLHIVTIISFLASAGTFVWLTYKFYKPAFTEITFYESGILSKTHFEKEYLEMEDIKGIWFLRSSHQDAVIEDYSPDNKPSKGSMIIIGDIDYFDGAAYFGLNMATTLHDSFSNGYTAIRYRKALDPILDYYYKKTEAKNAELSAGE